MNPITRECQDCPDLQKVLADIDCTLLDLSLSKYNSVIYGVDSCCSKDLYRTLVNYKRIITARLYNPHYPCSQFTSNELLSKIRLLTNKTNCSRCPECEEVLTTTTTTVFPPGECVTYFVSSQFIDILPIEYPYSYLDCEGIMHTGTMQCFETLNICATKDSVVINTIFDIVQYSTGCNITTTTTTTSTTTTTLP